MKAWKHVASKNCRKIVFFLEISTCVLLKREGMDPILLPMHRKILLAHSFLSRSLNTKHFSFRINHLMIFIINFYTMKLMTLKGLWYLVGIKVCDTARHLDIRYHHHIFTIFRSEKDLSKAQNCNLAITTMRSVSADTSSVCFWKERKT